MGREVLISIRDLCKTYFNGRDEKSILKGVSFDIFANEFLVILGKSGTGKSVLLKHIIGLENPDSGEIIYHSSLYSKTDKLKNDSLGLVFQGSALFDFLSVKENIAFPLRSQNQLRLIYSEKDIDSKVNCILEKVGLLHAKDLMPSELSGGMSKRVALARALVYPPRVLLYDEPTTGLDPITGYDIAKLIKEFHMIHNNTGVIVTHDMNLALFLADRIAIHDQGNIITICNKNDFISSQNPLIREFLDSNQPYYGGQK